jgi:hypothetical protein
MARGVSHAKLHERAREPRNGVPPRGSLAGSDQPSGRRSGPAVLHVPVPRRNQELAGHKHPFAPPCPGRDTAGRRTPAARWLSQLATFPRQAESTQPSPRMSVWTSQVSPQSGHFHGSGSSFSQAARSVTGSRDAPHLPLLLHRGLLHDPLHDLASHVLGRLALRFLLPEDLHACSLPSRPMT